MAPPLFIGRFQPFHLGHLDAIDQIFDEIGTDGFLYIGIGSAEKSREPENPYTCGERFEMIDESLKAAGIDKNRYAILMARDIDNDEEWVEHIKNIFPTFGDVYIMNSELAETLFRKHGEHKVIRLKKRKDISATEVRRLMMAGENWSECVPPYVAEAIEKINLRRVH